MNTQVYDTVHEDTPVAEVLLRIRRHHVVVIPYQLVDGDDVSHGAYYMVRRNDGIQIVAAERSTKEKITGSSFVLPMIVLEYFIQDVQDGARYVLGDVACTVHLLSRDTQFMKERTQDQFLRTTEEIDSVLEGSWWREYIQ